MPSSQATRLRLGTVTSVASEFGTTTRVRPYDSILDFEIYNASSTTNGPIGLHIGDEVLIGLDQGRWYIFGRTSANTSSVPGSEGGIIDVVNIRDIIAAASIARRQILDAAIDRIKIAQGEVTRALIEIDAIDGTLITDDAIQTNHIAAKSIVGAHIVGGTIDASNIASFSITAAEIAALTIVADNISANAIIADKIAAGAITADKIAANSITAGKIVAQTLTVTQMADILELRIGQNIQSNSYDPGVTGWIINGLGDAEFNDVVIRGTLESNNYAAGTDGWRLDQDGDAEFNEGTFRGAIVGSTIDIGGADTTSFHVNASGQMWIGAATFANATFRVDNDGHVQIVSDNFADPLLTFKDDSGVFPYAQYPSIYTLGSGGSTAIYLSAGAGPAGYGDSHFSLDIGPNGSHDGQARMFSTGRISIEGQNTDLTERADAIDIMSVVQICNLGGMIVSGKYPDVGAGLWPFTSNLANAECTLELRGSTYTNLLLYETGGNRAFQFRLGNASNDLYLRDLTDSAYTDANANAWNNISRMAYKDNVVDIRGDDALSGIGTLELIRYSNKGATPEDPRNNLYYGFDVEQIAAQWPDIIHYIEGTPEAYSLAGLLAVSIRAIQQLTARVEELEAA